MPSFPLRQEGQYIVPTQDEAHPSPAPTYTFPSQPYTKAGGGADSSFALFTSLDLPSPRTFFGGGTLGWALCILYRFTISPTYGDISHPYTRFYAAFRYFT
ncbi:hypothetical protein VNO77_01432 [Canavalia gladiata]|uniref:Uncharacterized protein n=1 Tax=Canavalia gladiata TaxID=3824 RepID=A0AAN9MRU9_CANGL